MAEEKVKVWYDKEADYLEVNFKSKEGYFKETGKDAVMEKVDKEGNVIGFSIQKGSDIEDEEPISVELHKRSA